MKKLPIIFAFAFALNWIWEHFHSRLYVHYMGGEITDWILFRAAFGVDAVIITLMALLFIKVDYFRERIWWVLILGIVPALFIEWFALTTGRWAYGPHMPIIPILRTGLTPTIQLALTAYASYKLARLDKGPRSKPAPAL